MSDMGTGKVDFSGLVAGLATSAVAILSQVELLFQPAAKATPGAAAEQQKEPVSIEQRRKRISDGLAGARQLIDTLAVLEEKTKGNLSAEESELLQSALSELRIRFVSLANRPLPEKADAEGGAV
jgi:threonine dehydratase